MADNEAVMTEVDELIEGDRAGRLDVDERLRLLSHKIIASVIRRDEMSDTNRQYLYGQVSPKVFRDEDYLIYSIMYNLKDKGIVPDDKYLKLYMLRHTKVFDESREYIDFERYKGTTDDDITAFCSAVLRHYDELIHKFTTLDIDSFRLELEKYKVEFSSFEMNKAYNHAKVILYDGEQVGRQFKQGYEDSVAHVKSKIADIEAVLDHTTGAGFIDSRKMGIIDDNEAKPELLCDFGAISELNEHLGGIYTGIFYSIMAPTKGGKSKFTTRMIHNIIMQGHNVSVWAHEGGYQAWWAQLRAIHYHYMYILNADEGRKVVPLSQDEILYGKYPSDEVRKLEETSRLDLFTNPNYGNIYMIDRPFLGETFIEEIETSVALNNSRAVLIDYLQLISSNEKGKSKPQVIGKAYQDFLAYCKKRNVAGISPSQFTQDFMSEMAKSKDGQAHEVRTAGGESAEVFRTPDINIVLYATVEDLMRKEMTIMSAPSRLCQPFPDFKLYADLCSCYFSSVGGKS